MKTRRQFLRIGATVGVGALAATGEVLFARSRIFASVQTGQTPLLGANVQKYVDPLPTFAGNRVTGTSLTVSMHEFQQKVLPTSFYNGLSGANRNGTFLRGYQIANKPTSYPGVTIEAQRNTPTTITYINNLPAPTSSNLENLLTVDQTIHWADPFKQMGATVPYSGPIPTVVHLHGAEVHSMSDGSPESWFTADGHHGIGYSTTAATSPNAAVYSYPNTQPGTTLWFHDHALGMTRINVFSGLSAFYLLRDKFDTGLASNPLGLPAGAQEVELMIQDRQFDLNGQLLFPDGTPADNPTGLNGPPTNPGAHPFWIPEFFGDVMVVNGKSWPFLNVEPRRYRFRFLDASNARFLRMHLVDAATQAPGPAFWQIGTDGGLLDRPVKINDPANSSSLPLFLAPSERADIIIDFSGHAGHTFTLVNDAQAPFPTGNDVDPATTAQIMQFRVNLPLSSTDTTFNPANGGTLRGHTGQPPAIIRLSNPATGTLAPGVTVPVTRQLALIEVEGPGGPLEVTLNNTKWKGVHEGTTTPLAGSESDRAGQSIYITEIPQLGATEVWEITNLTQDAHPIHIHLIQFQLINRQTVDGVNYRTLYDSLFPGGTFAGLLDDGTLGTVQYAPGTFIPGYGPPLTYGTPNKDGAIGGTPAISSFLQGSIMLPDVNEIGWKDTIKVYPGLVTRLAIRWAPIETAVNGVKPSQNLYAFNPTNGPGYAWHCHILDHEDNEMMRLYYPKF